MFARAGHGGGEGPDVSVVADAPPADIFCKQFFISVYGRTLQNYFCKPAHNPLHCPNDMALTPIRTSAGAGDRGAARRHLQRRAQGPQRRLCQFDPLAELAELKGRADGEMLASDQLHQAAAAGDAKAALDILKHVHGWVARQAIDVNVEQTISIKHALELAQQRVVEGAYEVIDHADAPILPARGDGVDGAALEPPISGRSA
jgi:hypothetical protein